MKMRDRWLSVDVFRGLTVFFMIIVNSPGNQTAYTYLDHAAWHGCTIADLVFPFFIFILGVSVVLSLSKKPNLREALPKLLKRTVILFCIGLFLNAFPKHFDFSTLRILGVLQRIALCYFFSACLYLTTRVRTQAIIILLLLLGYSWIMMLGDYSLEGNVAAYFDRLIFSTQHLYTSSYDPEGLLSTLPAIATALLGNLLGAWLLTAGNPRRFLRGTLMAAFLALTVGWLWGLSFPINKALWTSSYVLWTGGLALLVYAACYWWVEIKQWQIGTYFFALFGTNALLVFVLHVFFLKLQAIIMVLNAQGQFVSLRLFLTDYLFGWASLKNASLMYAISYTTLWWCILYLKKARSSKKVGVVLTN